MSASGYLAWAQSKEGFRDVTDEELKDRLEQLNLTGDQCEAVTAMIRNARIEGAAAMKQFATSCMADLETSLEKDFGLWSSPSFARCRSAAYRAWRDTRNLNPVNFAKLEKHDG